MMKYVVMAVSLMFLLSCGKSAEPPYTQVDRVGRPLIQIALGETNTILNEWNGITPDRDLGVLGDDIREEVTSVLDRITTAATASGLTPPGSESVMASFFPDVMRIDTEVASGYNADSVTMEDGNILLTGGRKITDDVGDIMVSYFLNGDLSPGNTVPDNVSYLGTGGNSSLQGHTAPLSAFPFLAPPQ